MKFLLCLLLFTFTLQAGLKEPGWNPQVKARLQRLIKKKTGSGLPVIFDFDNTLLCRDIGEATFEVMASSGALSLEKLPLGITPPAVLGSNVLETYEKFLGATKHHALDKTSYLNAYGWLVQIMAGRTAAEITEATALAYGTGEASSDVHKPYFYPEMVELVAEFKKAGFDVWVVSASNVWSVRWMVTKRLNQLLVKRGLQNGIAADHVVGINTLLEGPEQKLYKDQFLVTENAGYQAGKLEELAKYQLTTQIIYPMSASFGKAAVILERIGKMPYLVAGDSPNDHGMLSIAEHKLWINRLDKPAYLSETKNLASKTQPKTWMYQATLNGEKPGFRVEG